MSNFLISLPPAIETTAVSTHQHSTPSFIRAPKAQYGLAVDLADQRLTNPHAFSDFAKAGALLVIQ